MKGQAVPVRQKNRIITPADSPFSNLFGKHAEGFQYLSLVRYLRFDLFSVGCDRHKPELRKYRNLIESSKHRFRVLGTKGKTIHHIRRQTVPCDLLRIVRISHKHIFFPDPPEKPVAVTGRNICPHPGIDYHSSHSFPPGLSFETPDQDRVNASSAPVVSISAVMSASTSSPGISHTFSVSLSCTCTVMVVLSP